jgi:hypothetical protein
MEKAMDIPSSIVEKTDGKKRTRYRIIASITGTFLRLHPVFDAFTEGAVLFPEGEDFFLTRREVCFWVNRFVHGEIIA